MALTDLAIRKVKAGDKPFKVADGAGLYLYVTSAGGKSWRFKYRHAGKEKRLTFGLYPEVSLLEARDRRDAARRMLREGQDPAIERERRRASAIEDGERTFESVARRWHADQAGRLTPHYHGQVLRALERDIFPTLGKLPIVDVDRPMVVKALRAVQARGSLETARRIGQQVSSVFMFAMDEGTAKADPAAKIGKALRKPPAATRYPAITELDELHAFLSAFERAPDVGLTVRFASRLLALTAVRPGVLIGATWDEFEDIDWSGSFIGPLRPLWRISAQRMKLAREKKGQGAYEHLLPLARQTVDLLRVLRDAAGRSPYLFPGAHSWRRPISGDTIRMAYRRLGYGALHVPHGWRSSFSTIMNDRARRDRTGRAGDRQLIDMMLAHVPEGMSAAELRYNRVEHMADFRRLAQEWADVVLAGQRHVAALLALPAEDEVSRVLAPTL